MKRLLLVILIAMITTTLTEAIDRRVATPGVRYIEPKNDAVVNLAGKKSLVFKWKSTPKPGGGRMAYKFDLYKDFGYEVVVSKKINYKIYSIEIPAEKFKDGALYTWQVKQRDADTRVWSMDNRWSFKVKK